MLLSIAVAITGISVPIGLSFTLQSLLSATPLQAFAAGAALCSTSLGTTFTVLSTSGLTKSRLGVVLTSAAMMDDVVGLVMVQVISNLGGSASSFSATTVIRPVFVSLAFAVLIPLACHLIVKPTTIFLNKHREANPTGLVHKLLPLHQTTFAIHTAILFGFVTGGTYAGTSNLFTSYLAGACISWWDGEMSHLPVEKSQCTDAGQDSRQSFAVMATNNASSESDRAESIRSFSSAHISGLAIYKRYYQQAVEKILKPLFFVRKPYRTRLPCSDINSQGINRFFNPHLPDVHRFCRMAWYCLHNSNDSCEIDMRPLARSLLTFAVHPRAFQIP